MQARDLILKLLEVIVLKFKSIAKYQVTHLLESANNKTSDIGVKRTITEHESADNEPIDKDKKLDLFLNSFEDKDRVKVGNSIKKNNCFQNNN